MSQKHDGLVLLDFKERNGRTITTKKYYEGNSRVSADTSQKVDKTPYYFLINMGGGFLEGEDYFTQINLAEKAHAVVTTQAPTYVFKCDKHGWLTKQVTKSQVASGAYLEYLADEVIPYLHSRYFQHNVFELEEDSELVYSDGVTAGWSPDEEAFQYDYFHSLTQIYQDGRLIFHDNMLLEPKKADMSALGYFEQKTNYNNLVIVSKAIDDAFLKALREFLEEKSFESDYGVSLLAVPGLAIKILGTSAQENRKVILACIDFFRKTVKNLPNLALRKNERRN